MLLFALTILASAFLLFQVQPLIAKTILPWFGGSAAVWTTCLLFFQVVLLLGYLYAHALTRHLRAKAQAAVHIALLAASLAVLPIAPDVSWKPSGNEDPALRILLLLAATVGLPYFLLSTTGPLVQAWYSRRFKGALPYRLYALSNAGSMFALLSYPVLFEPVFTTRQQAIGWSAAYLGFALLCGLTAWVVRRHSAEDAMAARPPEGPPTRRTWLLWMALAACASILLLAVSNHLSQNVAAIPFLWVLPLSLYLLSFILCFEGSGWYRRNPYLQLFAVAVASMAYALSEDFENTSVKVLIPLFAAGLFLCCMVCHGELVRLKPHPRYLTSFYLMISAGGAAGGVLVGLVAPRLFPGFFELQAGLAATAVLLLLVLAADPASPLGGGWRRPPALVAGLLTAGLIVYLAMQIRQTTADARLMVRNFYGGLRVSDSGAPDSWDAVRKLTHGTINHGEQFLNPQRRDRPTTYYGPETGVGLAIREAGWQGPLRVGVIGLGAGTLAAFGRPGDYYRFYEINPLVLDIARTQFTFLKDSHAQVEVAPGDARLSLEREPKENFDVLAVDAFSSDSIPVHLLTREAFALYFEHLKESGVLAVHVSNRYLDLRPVLQLEAVALAKPAVQVDTDDDDANDVFGATWILLSNHREFLEKPAIKKVAEALPPATGLRLWTDNYSNLFQILK